MSTFSHLFTGRLSRRQFVLGFLATVIAPSIVLMVISAILQGIVFMLFSSYGELSAFGTIISSLLSLVLFVLFIPVIIATLGLYVRRFHDLGKGGVYVLLTFIPFVNLIVLAYLIFMKGVAGPNMYGATLDANASIKDIVLNKEVSTVAPAATSYTAPVTPVEAAPVTAPVEVAPVTAPEVVAATPEVIAAPEVAATPESTTPETTA